MVDSAASSKIFWPKSYWRVTKDTFAYCALLVQIAPFSLSLSLSLALALSLSLSRSLSLSLTLSPFYFESLPLTKGAFINPNDIFCSCRDRKVLSKYDVQHNWISLYLWYRYTPTLTLKHTRTLSLSLSLAITLTQTHVLSLFQYLLLPPWLEQ